MKSVGETMAIGRTFKEALDKAIRSLEIGRFGLSSPIDPDSDVNKKDIVSKLTYPNSARLFWVAEAFRFGMSISDVSDMTRIDPWFLHQIKELVDFEAELRMSRPGRETCRGCKEAGLLRQAPGIHMGHGRRTF